MKQRILSLFLALCMLAVAVPAFLLPATAAEETGTTYEFRASDGNGRTNADGAGTLLSKAVGAAALANILEVGVPGAPADLIGWYTWANGEFVSAALYAAGLTSADETVTFYPVTKSTTFSAKSNMPLSDPTALYGFRGGWIVGGYSGSAFTQFGALSVGGGVLTAGNNTEWGRGGMYLINAGYSPSAMILPSYGNSVASALRYRAIAAGEATFTLPKIEVEGGSVAVMAVVHNGTYLWPEALAGKAVSTIAADKASFADAPAAALTFALTLAVDDVVDVLVIRKNGASVGCALASPTVTYTGDVQVNDIHTKFEQTLGGANFPQISGTTVSQSGPWQVGRFKAGNFTAFDEATGSSLIRVSGEAEWGNGAMYFDTGSGGAGVPGMAILGSNENYVTAVQYTAPASANLDIALTVSFVRAGNAYAVLRNDEIIWPKSGATFTGDYKEGDWALTTEAKGTVSFSLSDIAVAAGDTISFVADRGTSESGQGFYGLQMEITGDLCPTIPSLSLRANLNDTFSLAFDLTAAGASDVTLAYTVNGETKTVPCTQNGDIFSAATAGVVASDMTAPITYTLQGKIGTQDYRFAAGETTFAAVMMRYVETYRDATDAKGKAIYELAVATLNYGAAAQGRFNAENTTLPNAGLTEEEKAYTLTGETADATLTTNADAIYTFAGASLLLEDTVKLKVFVNAQDGKTAPDGDVFLEYATSADFADAKTVKMVQRGSEGDAKSNASLKATLTILPDAYAETYYMRVVDGSGNVIGTVLTYSVAAYAARVPAEKELTDRIITMGEAAEAYLAAMKQA